MQRSIEVQSEQTKCINFLIWYKWTLWVKSIKKKWILKQMYNLNEHIQSCVLKWKNTMMLFILVKYKSKYKKNFKKVKTKTFL